MLLLLLIFVGGVAAAQHVNEFGLCIVVSVVQNGLLLLMMLLSIYFLAYVSFEITLVILLLMLQLQLSGRAVQIV